MAFLSNLFGSQSDSSSDTSTDLFSDLDAVVDLNFSNESYSHEVDDDGSSETTYDSTEFGTSADIGNILASMTDSLQMSDG